MRTLSYDLVDVFTKTRLEGNPLAVFSHADGLTDAHMQRIAGELNLSETVFLCAPTTGKAAGKARIFTPRRELDFAGHPTIGSAYVLSAGASLGTPFAIEENVGLVQIDVDTDQAGIPVFWLTTPHLTFSETMDAAFCARLLNVSVDDLVRDCSPQFVSAGSPLLFVYLSTRAAVDRAEFQLAHLNEALGSVNSSGTFVFARKVPQSDSCFDLYARMFAPQAGISEDPATGGATGPAAGYLLRYGKLPRRNLELASEQGRKMGRRSILHVRIVVDSTDVVIKVGGSVVPVAEGVFRIDG